MTYKKGDRVHVKHPSGPEWDGIISSIGSIHAKLGSGETVPFEWLTPIKPMTPLEIVKKIREYSVTTGTDPLVEVVFDITDSEAVSEIESYLKQKISEDRVQFVRELKDMFRLEHDTLHTKSWPLWEILMNIDTIAEKGG